MKTLYDCVQGTVNECGGSYFIGTGGCGGGYYGDYAEYSAFQDKVRKKAAEEIPENVRKKYKDLLAEYGKLYDKWINLNTRGYRLKEKMNADRLNTLGVSDIHGKLEAEMKSSRGLWMTGSTTIDTIKMIAHLITEELDETKEADPETIKMMERIKELL